MPEPFVILHVCAANACRSPIAEYLTRSALERRLGPRAGEQVTVGSAGVHATDGMPMEMGTAELLARRGVETGEFASQALSPDLIERADLVLTATRAHRPEVLRRHPPAARYTFTLAEFGRLASWLEQQDEPQTDTLPVHGRRLVAAIDALRRPVGVPPPAGQTAAARTTSTAADTAARARLPVAVLAGAPGTSGAELDLDDPSGGKQAGYDTLADLVEGALRPFLHVLCAGYEPPPAPKRRGLGRWFAHLPGHSTR
jgi:protein-tyrosine phosphatase